MAPHGIDALEQRASGLDHDTDGKLLCPTKNFFCSYTKVSLSITCFAADTQAYQAPLALTPLTPQRHLLRAALSTPQMPHRNIRQRLNKHRATIQTLRALHPRMPRLMDDLLIQLEERLDMVAGERDGDEHQVGLAFLDVALHRVAGLGAQPGGGPDLRLPAEAVGVAEAEALHYGVDGGADFGGVGVSWSNVSAGMGKDVIGGRTSVHDTHG